MNTNIIESFDEVNLYLRHVTNKAESMPRSGKTDEALPVPTCCVTIIV